MKVSIVGITGYSGLELVKILNNHKKVELVSIHATKEVGRRLSDVYPYLTDVCDLDIEAYDAEKIMKKADLVFFATPSGVASSLAEEFVQADFPIIDLSGDHRVPFQISCLLKAAENNQCCNAAFVLHNLHHRKL